MQQTDHSISLQDRADLLNTILHGNANDIASKVMMINETRKALEKMFKDDLDSDAALITNNKSVLYRKSFEDLQSFQWGDIVSEKQPTFACCNVQENGYYRESSRNIGAKSRVVIQYIDAGALPQLEFSPESAGCCAER